MKTKPKVQEMRSEYVIDYSKAVRGKYYGQLLKEGSNVVVLESDVAKAFPTSAAVNEALRLLLQATAKVKRPRSPAIRSRK
jgi:hypothetical protein